MFASFKNKNKKLTDVEAGPQPEVEISLFPSGLYSLTVRILMCSHTVYDVGILI
jgi:hypothetical protein